MTVDEVMAEVLKDKPFYEQTGGGITISGGEPLLHPVFLRGILQACKDQGIQTAIETTGFCTEETLQSVLPLVDLFLFDIKIMDNEAHQRFTGVGNERILTNLDATCRAGKSVIVRIPIIPGVNDYDGNIQAIVSYLREHTTVSTVHLLPYHSAGHEKALRLGKETESLGIPSLDEDRLHPILQEFQRGGFSVAIGG
jgi:pyruvate formate lyase activating enzyme